MDRSQQAFRWVPLRLAALAGVAVLGLAGCGDDDDSGAATLEAEMTQVLDALGMSALDGPEEVRSKDIKYLSATGQAEGSVAEAIDAGVAELEAAGFDMDASAPVPGGVAAAGRRDEVAVRVAAFDQLGTEPAPAGSSWVQVQVAGAQANLAWIP